METNTKEVKLELLRSRMFVGIDHLGNSIAIGYQREEEPFAQHPVMKDHAGRVLRRAHDAMAQAYAVSQLAHLSNLSDAAAERVLVTDRSNASILAVSLADGSRTIFSDDTTPDQIKTRGLLVTLTKTSL